MVKSPLRFLSLVQTLGGIIQKGTFLLRSQNQITWFWRTVKLKRHGDFELCEAGTYGYLPSPGELGSYKQPVHRNVNTTYWPSQCTFHRFHSILVSPPSIAIREAGCKFVRFYISTSCRPSDVSNKCSVQDFASNQVRHKVWRGGTVQICKDRWCQNRDASVARSAASHQDVVLLTCHVQHTVNLVGKLHSFCLLPIFPFVQCRYELNGMWHAQYQDQDQEYHAYLNHTDGATPISIEGIEQILCQRGAFEIKALGETRNRYAILHRTKIAEASVSND